MFIIDGTFVAKKLASNGGILVIDTRASEDFASGSIKGATNVCSSALIIRRLAKGNYPIESLLNEDDKAKYEQAKTSETVAVVVCDQSTTSVDQLTEDSVAIHLLRKISRECKFAALLSGGYAEFLKHHRHLCTVSGAKKLHSKRPSNLSLQLSTLSLDTTSSPRNIDIAAAAPPSSPSPTFGKDCNPHQILDHLFLGCRKAASTPQKLRELGITRILNVTPVASQVEILDSFVYKQIAVEDSHDVNMLQHLPDAFAFIEDARLCRERVLVHCHAGMSRSVTIILAYLMKYYEHSLESAYDFVKQRKSDIAPNFSFMGQLLEFQLRLSPVGTPDSGIDSPMQITFSPCIMAI